ncbi:hypothetical protein L1987_81898 [Smallanthus sonchifolius]|uniref:Uncharacterized protein n=1 Tax=Smallanthus sonchifolius TaxID=185202 RepID=A0ACB8YSU6_9ASTR|nr:hypothetical protein L1987_81898 [Smallanthus sonchifolius]
MLRSNMFYFHGGKGRDFALVSDTNLQINAHFIGSRPNGRRRDYTWVQSVSIMFDIHTLIISAKKAAQWDDSVDKLLVKWDGEEVTVPFDGEAEWKTDTGVREVVVERTDDTNAVKVTVGGLVSIHMKAVPVTKEDDKAHITSYLQMMLLPTSSYSLSFRIFRTMWRVFWEKCIGRVTTTDAATVTDTDIGISQY